MDTTNPGRPVRLAASPGPTCDAAGCTETPRGQWQRRLTDAELAELPQPADPTDNVHAVFACGPHAIDMHTARRVHQATCSGPDSPALPQCDCTPEPEPEVQQPPEQQIPDHWVTTPSPNA